MKPLIGETAVPAHLDQRHPVELEAPDITPYRQGNTGVDYFTTFTSENAGPHTFVTAVVHGNEICGAIALDHFFKTGLRPRRGSLTVGFCNVAAYLTFDPNDPTASRYIEEDFNRLWSPDVLDGDRQSTELRRAREIRPLIDQADYLLDIHSMQNPAEALVLCGTSEKGRILATQVGVPRMIVADPGHDGGTRMRDYHAFGNPDAPQTALLVECGQHWVKQSADVATDMLYRFLLSTGTLDADDITDFIAPPPPPQQVIEVSGPVTIQTERFRFVQNFDCFDVVEHVGTVIAYDGNEAVRTPYDGCVLIMPTRRPIKGGTAVRLGRFVDAP